MPVDLHDLLGKVGDETTFVAFVRALADEFALSARRETQAPSDAWTPAALGWENVRIDAFLEAAAAWAEDSTAEMRAASANPTHRCAAMLLMGNYYE